MAAQKRTSDKISGPQKICRLYEPTDFTTISNKPLRDKRLSLEARGLLASIMSLPLDWCFNVSWAQKEFNVGRDKLYRIISELKAAGYMRYIRARDALGRLLEAAYYVAADPRSFDNQSDAVEPHPENPEEAPSPHPENPDTAEPTSGFSGHIQKKENTTNDLSSQKALPRQGDKSILEREENKRWAHRLQLYREKGQWPLNGSWGPMMGQRGCQVPAELVRLWEDTQGAAFRPETKKRAPSGSVTPRKTNGFERIGTLNLPGTSHD